MIDNPALAEMLEGADIEPELMREVAAYTEEGWQTFVMFDEDAIDERLEALGSAIDDDAPEHLRRAFNEVRAYHAQRRQEAEELWRG